MQRFFRNYRNILLTLLILMMIPMVFTCFFVRPVADELLMSADLTKAWQETGSLIEVMHAGANVLRETYMTHSGIFASMLLTLMPLSIFGTKLIGWNALGIIAALAGAMWYASQCLRLVCRGICEDAVRCAGLLLIIFSFLFIPNACEGFYWYACAVNYTFFQSVAIWLLGSMLRNYYTGRKSLGLVMLWSACAFFVGGANWMTQTSLFVVGGAYTLWAFWKKKPKRFLIPFLFLIAGFLVAALAPSTASRQNVMNVDVGFVDAVFESFSRTFSYVLSDKRWYLFMLLFLPVFFEIYRFAPWKYCNALWVPALSVCVIAATMFPVVYQCAYWAERHVNAYFIAFSVLLPLNVNWLLGWAMSRMNIRKIEMRFPRPVLVTAFTLIWALIGMISVKDMTLSPLKFSCTLQPVKVFSHLIDGSVVRFARDYDELVEYIQAHPNEHLVVNQPYQEDIVNSTWLVTGDPKDFRNIALCESYGKNNTIEYVP